MHKFYSLGHAEVVTNLNNTSNNAWDDNVYIKSMQARSVMAFLKLPNQFLIQVYTNLEDLKNPDAIGTIKKSNPAEYINLMYPSQFPR